MKLNSLLRLLGAAVAGAFVLAASPALSAQTAEEYTADGMSKMTEGNYDGAIADFTKVIELKPADMSAYASRGLAESAQGNFDGAINDFTQVIRFRANDAAAYLQRGKAKYLQGKIDGAVEDLVKATELKPKDGATYFHLALAKDAQNNLEDAIAAVSQHGLPVAPVTLHQRSAYAHALTAGQTAEEYEPDGKAAEEIAQLFKWLGSLLAF